MDILETEGSLDNLVSVADARDFARKLAATSSNPVAYAELPGAWHAFDLLYVLRFEIGVVKRQTFGHGPPNPKIRRLRHMYLGRARIR